MINNVQVAKPSMLAIQVRRRKPAVGGQGQKIEIQESQAGSQVYTEKRNYTSRATPSKNSQLKARKWQARVGVKRRHQWLL